MTKCSQCDKPAIVLYESHPLCVEHYRMMMQIEYYKTSSVTAHLNFIRGELNAGGLIQYPLAQIPPNPFVGSNVAFNNINVNQSTIGALNTGTISNLDVAISLIKSRGEIELAQAIQNLTQAIIDNTELTSSTKDEINEQLEYLVVQATTNAENRAIGTIKSVLSGIRNYLSPVATLLTLWNALEPLIKANFGIG